MTPNQLPPLPEPDSYQFQHDETGQTMFVDRQQVEWGFEANNPRLHKIGSAFTTDQMHAYALAALAQQAQGEPVYQVRGAFDADPVNTWRDTTETAFFFHPVNQRRILYTTSQLAQAEQRITPEMWMELGKAQALLDRQKTQPAPQVPAPVDEQAEFEASMREKHGWEGRDFQSDSFGYFDGHTDTAWLAWQARAALQTKGQP